MKRKLLVILLLLPLVIQAQVDRDKLQEIFNNKGDLKVGVVLSGGGAKGVAHVGVLRMIENAGVQIDYIGGTSMGAIVSSLYAIGYTVEQLDSIIRGMDMSKMVQGELDRKYKTFFAKRYDNTTFAKLPVKNWNIGLPDGLSNGQDVMDKFNELTRNAHGNLDYNDFETPLVIMGTDIVTGESIEYHSGSLPLAMRASSSFPSLFAPVEVNDRLMVDGGVANNFPVKEVANLGADVLIGVSVEDGLYGRNDLNSINSIIEQITSFKMVEKSTEQKELLDVFIKPDITGYSVVSFDKAPEIIEKGEIAGFEHFNDFITIAEIQNRPEKVRPPLVFENTYNIVEFEASDLENYSSGYFKDNFELENLPRKISISEIQEGVNYLKGRDVFDLVNYEIIKVGEGEYKLKIIAKEKPISTFLKAGIHYDLLYKAGALINLTINNKILKSSHLMMEGVISERPRLNITYFKDNYYLPGFLFQTKFTQFNVDVPASALKNTSINIQGNYMNIETKDWTSNIMLQKTINDDFFIGAGAEYKWVDIYTNSLKFIEDDGTVSDKPFVIDRSEYFGLVGQIYADTRDDADYPTKGFYFYGDYKFYQNIKTFSEVDSLDDKNSNIAKIRLDYTLPVNSYTSWTNSFAGSIRFGGELSNALAYTFGGYNNNNINYNFSFFGYELFAIASQHDQGFLKYYTNIQFQLDDSWFLKVHANFMEIVGSNDQWFKDIGKIDHTGFALTIANKSILGPVELTTSYSPEVKEVHLMFNFGFWF